MDETDDFNEIFAALKHPLRRQILLFLEDKGEVSFTEILNALKLHDTGMLSYHLKELAPLIDQSPRGKYRLSEVGHASVMLFRKVETEKEKTTKAVHKEIEKLIGEVLFLFFIFGITVMAPLSVDIILSVQAIVQPGLSSEQVFLTNSIGLLGMILGVLLFVFYDRHYFGRSLRRNVLHTTIFAVAVTLLSISSVYFEKSFVETASANGNALLWLFGVLRSISLVAIAPIVAYAVDRLLANHRFQTLSA